VNIQNLNSVVAMHHLIMMLQSIPFVNSLCKKPASNLDELQMRVTKYMPMNELDEYQNQVRAEAVSAKKDNDKPGSNRGHDEGRRDRPPQESHFTQYIPLTANKSHIMDQALVVNILTMLKKTNTPSKADYSKHYWYHCNCGHSTEKCSALKDKIQEFIQLGHLKKFVHKQ